MPIKTVFSSAHNRHVSFGRVRPAPDPKFERCLRFGDYVGTKLPTPPATADYSAAATAVLADIYLNDSLGDCVIAGGYHIEGVLTGNAGNPFLATTDQITKDYGAIGGYVPGKPGTDQGCNEEDALNYWTKTGFASGNKLAGWVKVDATNKVQCQQALFLFENLYHGVELPKAWTTTDMPQASGFTWDVAGAPDPSAGHCIVSMGYSDKGLLTDTWGLLGTVTWAALAKYMVSGAGGECYALIGPEMLAKGMSIAPNGIDWYSLVQDFNAMGASPPIPLPAPTPIDWTQAT